MSRIQNFEQIINPKVDFMIIDDLKEEPKYLKMVHSRIFAEITNFLENRKGYKLEYAYLRKNKGHFGIKHNNAKYEIVLNFEKEIVDLYFNDIFITSSNIFGATIDKEKGIARNIKIDLSTLKQKIRELIG